MDSIIIGIEILVIIILIVLNGLFSLAEIAVVSTRRIRMQKIADEGNKRALLVLDFKLVELLFLNLWVIF